MPDTSAEYVCAVSAGSGNHLLSVTAAREAARSAALVAAAAAASSTSNTLASERVGAALPTEANDFVEGGYLFTTPKSDAMAGRAWSRMWCMKSSANAELEPVDLLKGFGDLHDGQWKVIALESHRLEGTLHLMGTRRGTNKCSADLAEVLVFKKPLPDVQMAQVLPNPLTPNL